MSKETTSFGFEQVAAESKARRVRAVFDSVVDRYDLMNDLMSLGIHRLWKRFTAEVSAVRDGAQVLDLAGGSGDMTKLFAERVGATGGVVLADINAAMLARGRQRLLDVGVVGNVAYVQADAERLPFPDRSFDCVCTAFGLRNVTHKERALAAIHRVLRPGGKVLVLEFSHLTVPALQPLYDAWSFEVLPRIGKWVARDSASYRYLAESIRLHPDQEHLLAMMEGAGFERCSYFNLSLGLVALHRGYRL